MFIGAAARVLGCPFGTVATRLARARQRLRDRLTRRGLGLSGGLLGILLAGLVNSTVRAAVALAAGKAAAGIIATHVAVLTEGVLRTMLMSKLKTTAAVVLAVGIAGMSAGVLSYRTRAADDADTRPGASQPVPARAVGRSAEEKPATLEKEPRLEKESRAARQEPKATKAELEQAPAAPAQNTDWANQMFHGDRHHDFGSVAPGSQVHYRFPIKNTWTMPLHIEDVRAPAGCTTATVSRCELKRGQAAYLDVSMDARRFLGSKTVTVYVELGPPYASTGTVRVSANSRPDVVFNPGQIRFGVVPRGQTPTQTIDVDYAGNLDWRIREVLTNGAPLDVQLEELYRRPAQVGYRIRATIKANAPPGAVKQELLLRTNDPASPEVPVRVEAVVQAPLAVKPDTLDFGVLKVGDAMSKKVIVSGSQPFKVLAIEGLGDDLQADLPAAAAAVQVVTLRYEPASAGTLKRKLLIKTDRDRGAPVTIAVRGTCTP